MRVPIGTVPGPERGWWGWLLPLAAALAWLPAARGQPPQPLPEDLPAASVPLNVDGQSAPGTEPSPEILPVGCTTCGSGLISGVLRPPDPGFAGVSGCNGCGLCYPGRDPCYCCDDKDTIFGRFCCALYACICCPDPCYEGKWTPLADSAFYLDAVRPVTQQKLRWDGGRDLIDPDRSEFFWARADGMGKGPKPPKGFLAETSLRYDDFTLVTEGGNGMISLVVETPFRNLQGDVDGHASGFGDMTIATKTLLFDCELLQFSFQMKVYTPTGNFLKGLGTGHVSLEPSFLLGIKLDADHLSPVPGRRVDSHRRRPDVPGGRPALPLQHQPATVRADAQRADHRHAWRPTAGRSSTATTPIPSWAPSSGPAARTTSRSGVGSACSFATASISASPPPAPSPSVRLRETFTPRSSACGIDRSLQFIHELPRRIDAQMNLLHRLALGHARQELPRQVRQQRSRQDVIDVSRPALHFLAPPRHRVDQLVVVAERRLVVRRHPVGDLLQLQLDDLAQHLVAQGEVRHQRAAAQERRLERLQQFRPQRFQQAVVGPASCPDRRTPS